MSIICLKDFQVVRFFVKKVNIYIYHEKKEDVFN